jgi:hypothetical protein
VVASDVETAKQISYGVIFGAVILAVLTAKFVRAAIAKALVILVLGGLVVVAINQRANITKCAKDIREEYTSGAPTRTTCRFFGYSFTVSDKGQLHLGNDLGTVTTEPASASGG